MTITAQAELPLLQLSLLEKHYGSRALLKIDQLSLNAGQAILLSGRNGAGKSTLLKILAGLEPCQLASFRYRNQLLSKRQRSNLGGQIIYLHQHPFLFDTSVAANIGFGLTRLSRNERDARIAQALDWSGLSHLAERNAKTLSGGEQQRVALARAWVMEPELLLMDEPTANMDSESRQQTQFLIRRLINEGRTVVLSSHDLKSEQRLFHRHWRLRDGQIEEQPLASQGIIAAESESAASTLKQITEL